MLDVDNAIPFLLERELIHPAWIVEGDLVIRSAASRNRNLRIEGPGGTGYLIKQPDNMTLTGLRTLGNEASFYEFCQAGTIRGRGCANAPAAGLPRSRTLAIHVRVDHGRFAPGLPPDHR